MSAALARAPRGRAKRLTPATGIAGEVRPLFRALAPGGSLTVVLAEGPFWRRESYRAVNSAAHAIFGAGGYRMEAARGSATVRVTRLARTHATATAVASVAHA